MGRGRRSDPEKIIKNRLKEGRGSGNGSEFKPYLTVRDVPSTGFVHRIMGWHTNRVHHFLSNLELYYFYIQQWKNVVIDIREQYPLQLSETDDIARRLGIRHPSEIRTKKKIVMTTDFLLDLKNNDGSIKTVARAIKPSSELMKERVIEKLEVERTYWSERNIEWALVTEREIPITVAKNIGSIYQAWWEEGLPEPCRIMLAKIEQILYGSSQQDDFNPFSVVAARVDDRLGLEPGGALCVARHLVARQFWLVDMGVPLTYAAPLNIRRAGDQP